MSDARSTSQNRLRIALVTDIHAGPKTSDIYSDLAIDLLTTIIDRVNAEQVDLLVSLGDQVHAAGAAEDKRSLELVRRTFDKAQCRVLALPGNNELRFLTQTEVAVALGASENSEALSIGDWTLLFWRANCQLYLDQGPILSNVDLEWLSDALVAARYPVILCSHVPLDEHSMVGNYYFEGRPDLASYKNGSVAREMILGSGKVVLALAGHVHWNALSVKYGTRFQTLASLSDTFVLDGPPSATWALLEAGTDGLHLEIRGREPSRWWSPLPQLGTHWRRPLSADEYTRRMKSIWGGPQSPYATSM